MSVDAIIRTLGYAGIFAILFAETGLLIGFFLPGDTLLISAGILAVRGDLNLATLLIGGSIAAVAGDAVGYLIGREAGPRLFRRDDSFWFRRDHLLRAERFFARHGGKTIVIARFIAAVRTFAPVVAGAARMPYPRFAVFNVVGAVGWVCSVTLAAFLFGNVVASLDRYVFIVTVAVLPLSVIVAVVQYLRLRRQRRQAQQQSSQPLSVGGDHPSRPHR